MTEPAPATPSSPALEELFDAADELAALEPSAFVTGGQRALLVLSVACQKADVGASVQDLAAAAGVPKNQLRKVMHDATPSATLLEAMAAMLRLLWPDLDTVTLGRRLVEMADATERHPLGQEGLTGVFMNPSQKMLAEGGRMRAAAERDAAAD